MENINLLKLVDINYLVEARPAPDSELVLVLAMIFALVLMASGAVWLGIFRYERAYPIMSRVRERTVRFLFVTGFVGLLLVFFRWQGIPYFSSRIWLLMWLISAAVWSVGVTLYLLKKFPQERKIEDNRLLKERYLPKPKYS